MQRLQTMTVALLLAAALWPPAAAHASSILYGATQIEEGGNLDGDFYIIDPATGNGTLVGAIGYGIGALAFDPTTGVLYASTHIITGQLLLTIDPTTGAGTVVGGYGLGGTATANDLTFDAAGNLYGVFNAANDFYSIDKSTGAASPIGDFGISVANGPAGVAFNRSTGVLYLMAQGLYTLDPATGAVTNTIGGPANIAGLGIDFSPDGTLFAIDHNGLDRALITVSTIDGSQTQVGSTVRLLGALAFSPDDAAAVPEPGAMLLVATGIALGVVRAARKTR